LALKDESKKYHLLQQLKLHNSNVKLCKIWICFKPSMVRKSWIPHNCSFLTWSECSWVEFVYASGSQPVGHFTFWYVEIHQVVVWSTSRDL